ncbi:MAG: UDP-N-acetyl glucosamine 2-epimerase, partial [Proteobacteria bacterium]|nr:UDP-N-acetyl glucosamine 2-epimerase [Pseudomonadota bacterium]
IIFGDTNATLSGVLASSKLGIPISHVEAGLRSFNRVMPEELNRIIADRLSMYLFCPNDISVKNLRDEGRTEGVFNVGDVMVDQIYTIQAKNNLRNLPQKPYVFMTLHRQETSATKEDLQRVIYKINELSKKIPIIFAMHPRMKAIIGSLPISYNSNFQIIEPLGYQDTILHIQNASCILTDSGGIQKEAYILKTPCVTLRTETEWLETLNNNWNRLVGLDVQKLEEVFYKALNFDRKTSHEHFYGNGTASVRIIEKILDS